MEIVEPPGMSRLVFAAPNHQPKGHLALGQRLGSLALGGDDQGAVPAFHVLGLVELVLPTCRGVTVRSPWTLSAIHDVHP